MYRPANLKKNLGVGKWAPVVISHAPGATKAALELMHLQSVTIQGQQFTPEELVALAEMPPAPEPTQEERAEEFEEWEGDSKPLSEDWHDTLIPELRPFYMTARDWER